VGCGSRYCRARGVKKSEDEGFVFVRILACRSHIYDLDIEIVEFGLWR
jgi:hypothetical protein